MSLPPDQSIGAHTAKPPLPPDVGWTRSRTARIFGYVVVVIAFGGAFAYGMDRIRYGFGINDEGSYLVQPMRLALGDVPFRDEVFNAQRMYDILLAPVFIVYPDVTVYQYRLAWLFVQLVCVLMLFRVFSRYAPAPLVALSCVATMYLANVSWTPAYHLMGTFLFVLSWALLFEAFHAHRPAARIALGALSGFAFWIGAMSYMPLLALAAVPVITLAAYIASGKRDHAVVLATGAHLGTLVLMTLTTVAVIGAFGLWGDWLRGTEELLLNAPYRIPLVDRLSRLYETYMPFASITMTMAALVIGIVAVSNRAQRLGRFANTRWGALLISVVWATSVFVALYGLGNSRSDSYFEILYNSSVKIVAALVGIHIGVIVARIFDGRAPIGGGWRLIYVMTLCGSLLFAFLQVFLSSMPWKAVFAALLLFVSGVVALYRSTRGEQPSALSERFERLW